jgi:hypothetical protein
VLANFTGSQVSLEVLTRLPKLRSRPSEQPPSLTESSVVVVLAFWEHEVNEMLVQRWGSESSLCFGAPKKVHDIAFDRGLLR